MPSECGGSATAWDCGGLATAHCTEASLRAPSGGRAAALQRLVRAHNILIGQVWQDCLSPRTLIATQLTSYEFSLRPLNFAAM